MKCLKWSVLLMVLFIFFSCNDEKINKDFDTVGLPYEVTDFKIACFKHYDEDSTKPSLARYLLRRKYNSYQLIVDFAEKLLQPHCKNGISQVEHDGSTSGRRIIYCQYYFCFLANQDSVYTYYTTYENNWIIKKTFSASLGHQINSQDNTIDIIENKNGINIITYDNNGLIIYWGEFSKAKTISTSRFDFPDHWGISKKTTPEIILSATGKYLYLWCQNEYHVLNIANPDNIKEMGRLISTVRLNPLQSSIYSFKEGKFLLSSAKHLYLFDATDPWHINCIDSVGFIHKVKIIYPDLSYLSQNRIRQIRKNCQLGYITEENLPIKEFDIRNLLLPHYQKISYNGQDFMIIWGKKCGLFEPVEYRVYKL